MSFRKLRQTLTSDDQRLLDVAKEVMHIVDNYDVSNTGLHNFPAGLDITSDTETLAKAIGVSMGYISKAHLMSLDVDQLTHEAALGLLESGLACLRETVKRQQA